MRFSIAACLITIACGGAECPEPRPTPVAAAAVTPQPQEPAVPSPTARMDLDKLDRVIRTMSADVRREGGIWEMRYEGVVLTIVTDVRADRMRIVAQIIAEPDMTPEQRQTVMAANFHTALDARYAVSRGVLFSAFIHPLSTLHPDDLQSGVRQTANLVRTFGTTYNSGELVFGAP